MKVHELGHAVLYVRDLERSRAFYGQVLGWREIGAFGTVTHSLYIEDPDGNELELYVDVLPPSSWEQDPALVMAPPKPLRL